MAGLTQYDANVKDASVFRQLMDAINTYVCECHDYSGKVREYIAIMDEEFYKIRDVLQQRLDDADRKLQQADLALTICESTPTYDSEGNPQQPSCSAEKWQRQKAKRQVEVAQRNMNQMNAILRQVDRLKSEYQSEEKRFMKLLDEKLPAGSACLQDESELMRTYMNEHPRQR